MSLTKAERTILMLAHQKYSSLVEPYSIEILFRDDHRAKPSKMEIIYRNDVYLVVEQAAKPPLAANPTKVYKLKEQSSLDYQFSFTGEPLVGKLDQLNVYPGNFRDPSFRFEPTLREEYPTVKFNQSERKRTELAGIVQRITEELKDQIRHAPFNQRDSYQRIKEVLELVKV